MSKLEAYKVAMRELEEATKAYQPIDEFLCKLSYLVDQSSVPLLSSLGLLQLHQAIGCNSTDREAAFITTWPTTEQIQKRACRLVRAFNATHEIYGELAADDRSFVREPPHRPKVRWYQVDR